MADNKVNSGLLEFSEDQKVFVALDAETSEVKKAVTIDGDGVETDIQGVQPTGKKEITSTAEVNVASYATAQVVDEDLVAGNIKKDVDILGVVGSYEPEVPASDFSTATFHCVKGTTSAESFSQLPLICIIDGEIAQNTGFETEYGDYMIVLYDGVQKFTTNDNEDWLNMYGATTSGNITYDSDTDTYIVTGDWTLTLNANTQ